MTKSRWYAIIAAAFGVTGSLLILRSFVPGSELAFSYGDLYLATWDLGKGALTACALILNHLWKEYEG